jgi:hypothetical protein
MEYLCRDNKTCNTYYSRRGVCIPFFLDSQQFIKNLFRNDDLPSLGISEETYLFKLFGSIEPNAVFQIPDEQHYGKYPDSC